MYRHCVPTPRVAVLHHARQDQVAGRAARGVRAGGEGDGARAVDRDELRHLHRPAAAERVHQGLRGAQEQSAVRNHVR